MDKWLQYAFQCLSIPCNINWLQSRGSLRVSPQHLQAYLDEYTFRFNRRFYPMTAFHSVLGLAAKTVAPTYAQLYSGEWTRAA